MGARSSIGFTRRGVTDFAQMTDLSRDAAGEARRARSRSPRPCRNAPDVEDGTTKFLLQLDDGRHIEAVYIPDTPAQTFCISTQVGCAMGCAFCLTGKMGLVRHLTAGEIAGQVRVLATTPASPHALQHRAHGHGRAAAQLRRDDEGAADARGRAGAGRASAARDALDGRPRAGHRTAGATSR